MRPVYSLGTSEKALSNLDQWQIERSFPGDLLQLGLEEEQLSKWQKNIRENLSKENLACCTYKDYNKNRKRHAAPTEALS